MSGPTVGEVCQVLFNAMSLGWGAIAAHGGSVPNCYRYRAYTDVYAIGTSLVEGNVWVGYGVNLLRANKVTHAGARGSCISGRRAGSWWKLKRRPDPLDLAEDMADPIVFPARQLTYGTLAALVSNL